MITFNDLLEKVDLTPKEVLIMRHRPTEPGLRKVLPWYAAERPKLFNAYQQAQAGKNAEAALAKATYLAAFLGDQPGIAHFVGLYRNNGSKTVSKKEYWAVRENQELHRAGMSAASLRANALWFDLQLLDLFSQWQGKLVIKWTGLERAWYRWAHRNQFPVQAILETSTFSEEMPRWNDLVLNWHQLHVLPSKWSSALSHWRGIYLIFDTSDGQGYVGSAYGNQNILGRWRNYAVTGDGGNKALKKRDPDNFRFSILERVSPDLDAADVIRIEASWKTRMHTREFGLNEN